MKKSLLMLTVAALALTSFASSRNNMAARSFGQLADGRSTVLYTLRARGGLTLEVSDYGARIVRAYAPDKYGNLADVALGWNTAGDYATNGVYCGATVGRFANRIRDGRFKLDGVEYLLPLNEDGNGRHCNLHSGPEGFEKKIWSARPINEPLTDGIEFTTVSPDGEMGFPGRLTCKVTYRVKFNNVLTIDYEAKTDKPTVVNLSNHAYWNLAGEASGDTLGQLVQISADRYTQTDGGLIPTKDAPVADTGFDLRELCRLGDKLPLLQKDAALKATGFWFDHNFVLNGQPGELHHAVTMKDPASGRVMEIWTTEPCLQVYGTQDYDGTTPAKAGGKTLPKYAAVVFETQHYPDSPNRPDFPSVVLRPGETFKSHTEYRFYGE